MTDLENEKLWNEYLYPGTNVLINNFNCRNNQELREIEATISFEKLLKLNENYSGFCFDEEYLKSLHKYVFGDIFPFAGEYRKVNMIKKVGTFLSIESESSISDYLQSLFSTINMSLEGCSNNMQYADTLARLYTGLVYCHPFREGNGRVIREFVREFSIEKSRELGLGDKKLDWSLIDESELNQYLDISHIFPGATSTLFYQALVPNSSKDEQQKK